MIPEVLCQDPPGSNDFGFRGFYYRNDLQKSSCLRQLAAASKIVVMDRYFVSTMSHFVASRHLQGKLLAADFESVLSALYADHYSVAVQPTHWIFLRSDAVRSWDRYRRIRVMDHSSLWTSRAGTGMIAKAMEICLRSREICAGTTLILDADAGVDRHVEQVREAICL